MQTREPNPLRAAQHEWHLPLRCTPAYDGSDQECLAVIGVVSSFNLRLDPAILLITHRNGFTHNRELCTLIQTHVL